MFPPLFAPGFVSAPTCSVSALRRPVLSAFLVLVVVFLCQAAAYSAPRTPSLVVESTPSRVVFRVDLDGHELLPSTALEGTVRLSAPGFVTRGKPGEPARLARKFLVGLPPEGSYSVNWRVLSSVSLGKQRLEPAPFRGTQQGGELGILTAERYEIDPAVYQAYQNPPLVAADPPAYIRRQRVLPVWVQPVSYDPVSGALTLAASIEVEVTFRGGSTGRLDGADGRTRTGQAGDPQENGLPSETPAWERIFSRLLVNAPQAAKWRPSVKFQRSAPNRLGTFLQAAAPAKLEVRETGVHKVTAATLVAAGFAANTPIDDLHLYSRDYQEGSMQGSVRDVAFAVQEGSGGTPGTFDGDDVLFFYGLRLRDDPSRGDTIEQFSDHNVYWLGSTSGPMMDERTLTPGFSLPDTASRSFPAFAHFEIDKYFREASPSGVTDFYVYNLAHPGETRVDFPFDVNALRPGTSLQLEAQLAGNAYLDSSDPPRLIKISLVNSLGSIVLNPGYEIDDKQIKLFKSAIPAASLVAGENVFRFERAPVGVHLNWVEVSYESLYRARGNTLRFNTGSLVGDTSLTVTGLADTDVFLFDVTDPNAPIHCLTSPALFDNVGGGYALTFKDAIATRKEYVLVPLGKMTEIGADGISIDTASELIGGWAEDGVDVLVIAHKDFVTGMGPWVDYREKQGHRVLLADVEDVYDEFNGGVPGTRGIDRFIRHFFERGGAGCVLLVGDGSEDNKRVHVESPPSFVPSHARAEYVGYPFNADEVVTLDRLYVKLPGGGGTVDDYPDLIIGRLPVGNPGELQIVLAKIFAYEQPKADDFWRRRMVIVADDSYSHKYCGDGGCFFGYKSIEDDFEKGQEKTARVIEAAFPGGYDVVRVYLDDHTQVLHPNNEDVARQRAIDYTRAHATPALMDELKQGATFVTIQAHMNRYLVCSEKLLTCEGYSLGSSPNRDHLRMDNRGKPFIVFGMGCHFSDYALHKESTRDDNRPNGDAFAEQLLFQNNEAAVATYGSSGFEYLSGTNAFMETFSWVWFYDAPYDTLIRQTEGHWVFGEMMFLTEIAAINYNPREEVEAVERYHILGDPLLRVDAGPPRFNVTVDGDTVQSGDDIKSRLGGDNIHVVANVGDENSIHDFELWTFTPSYPGGSKVNRTHDLKVKATRDTTIAFPRGYELNFDHKIEPSTYDVVIMAMQAPDAVDGGYHVEAAFVLSVVSDIRILANGRELANKDAIPERADYRIELSYSAAVSASEAAAMGVSIDDVAVADVMISTQEPGDSTSWALTFSKKLKPGRHKFEVAAPGGPYVYDLVVTLDFGLDRVVNYPNPFTDETYFMYKNNVEISEGTIDVYTTSGKKVVRLTIPPDAKNPGENAVFWDGRDTAGDEIANGVYLYVINVTQRGQKSILRGKLARIR